MAMSPKTSVSLRQARRGGLFLACVAACFLGACAGSDDGGTGGGCTDLDGDGFCALEDCDDSDATVSQNCTPTNCQDNDRDGFGEGPDCAGPDCNDSDPRLTDSCDCEDRDNDGYGTGNGCRGPDCNDDDAAVNPGRTEIPGNDVDENCDGDSADCIDMDGDGYGMGDDCRREGEDCDDTNASANPGARERCGNEVDEDCDGMAQDCAANCTDNDGDGYGVGDGCDGSDCDDLDPSVNEGAEEICNGKDDDCNGTVDECSDPNLSCDLARQSCFQGFLGACTRTLDCVTGLACDEMQCRGTAGIDCDQGQSHCARGFFCDPNSNKCAIDPDYDPCDDLDCAGDCVRERGCVECADSFTCPGVDFCFGYTCVTAPEYVFDGADPVNEMAQFIADCFAVASDDDVTPCGILDTLELTEPLSVSEVEDWVCDTAQASDFFGGEADLNRAQKTFGCSELFDNDDYDWPQALTPGVFWEECMWSLPPGGIFDSDPDIVVRPCGEYPVD